MWHCACTLKNLPLTCEIYISRMKLAILDQFDLWPLEAWETLWSWPHLSIIRLWSRPTAAVLAPTLLVHLSVADLPAAAAQMGHFYATLLGAAAVDSAACCLLIAVNHSSLMSPPPTDSAAWAAVCLKLINRCIPSYWRHSDNARLTHDGSFTHSSLWHIWFSVESMHFAIQQGGLYVRTVSSLYEDCVNYTSKRTVFTSYR